MLNVVICDDSTRDASQLEQYLLSYDKVPVETKLYTNPQKMLEQLTSDTHCVFLDIDMPQITGIDLAREIRQFNPFIPIIFVTSYRDYMEQVFEVQTFDYLVKPIEPQRLNKVLDRILRYLDLGQTIFNFSFGKQSYSIPLSDITYFEKDKRSVFIYTLADTYKSLLKTQDILDKLPNYFIQIHASYIVNPKYIKDFDAKTVTILLNGAEEHSLPISRKFHSSFKEKYYNYLSERNF